MHSRRNGESQWSGVLLEDFMMISEFSTSSKFFVLASLLQSASFHSFSLQLTSLEILLF
jgi:hypothetical protein